MCPWINTSPSFESVHRLSERTGPGGGLTPTQNRLMRVWKSPKLGHTIPARPGAPARFDSKPPIGTARRRTWRLVGGLPLPKSRRRRRMPTTCDLKFLVCSEGWRWRCNTVVCKREALELSSKAFSRLRRTSLNHKIDRWNCRGKTQAPAARAGKRLRDMSARQTCASGPFIASAAVCQLR